MSVNNVVTYSPAFTLVPTYECFNRCTYCNFRVEPQQDSWLSLAEAKAKLRNCPAQTIEILLLSGEIHPKSHRRTAWVHRLSGLAQQTLAGGFLPHTNAGPLNEREMAQLKTVNVSMGLMLEQLTPQLRQTVHRQAPSKEPALRLQQLEQAGKLRIPFTTGLLLGIGESSTDRVETLQAIAESHRRWGHIQEVILQPYSPGHQEAWQCNPFDLLKLPPLVALAREILPVDIVIQIPPNLVQVPTILLECIVQGARDLGGILPKDEVNPDYKHDDLDKLQDFLATNGWELRPRLPLYPKHYDWLSADLRNAVNSHLATNVTGT
ncbi:MAG: 7,8-didemethyl-8-hydroxy-5-deazariboflavin synthase subunit CofG [Cyanobacteria bacterium P01_H01_bin.15]